MTMGKKVQQAETEAGSLNDPRRSCFTRRPAQGGPFFRLFLFSRRKFDSSGSPPWPAVTRQPCISHFLLCPPKQGPTTCAIAATLQSVLSNMNHLSSLIDSPLVAILPSSVRSTSSVRIGLGVAA
jgi:hypothetical protein